MVKTALPGPAWGSNGSSINDKYIFETKRLTLVAAMAKIASKVASGKIMSCEAKPSAPTRILSIFCL